ncbi:Maf family protein [Stakelama saccharophila]|uniref:Nucleoside triphosphate pyrophosphatase n=1 Tax=Stakelama saccharophila TaxID=3075605 RepID=A0ABZ0BCC5_9SPHN|nr:nucleoside triphosphate pyrophosphatase [Stakelama sp. W311]WNO55085.1 nucleoside triphosphate pyrophosphatase [Stakelama sp. W311]
MLTDAGVPHEAMASGVDEDALKRTLVAESLPPRDFADALAEMKALRVSGRTPGALVLGGDSIAALEDGTYLDKPVDRDAARRHLQMLSGRSHKLISAAVIAEDRRPVWRHVATAQMHVRTLSDAFIERYLDAEWPAISGCVGCYRLEAMGVQLFSRIQGDYFTILGMPLLPILDYLRTRGVLTS